MLWRGTLAFHFSIASLFVLKGAEWPRFAAAMSNLYSPGALRCNFLQYMLVHMFSNSEFPWVTYQDSQTKKNTHKALQDNQGGCNYNNTTSQFLVHRLYSVGLSILQQQITCHHTHRLTINSGTNYQYCLKWGLAVNFYIVRVDIIHTIWNIYYLYTNVAKLSISYTVTAISHTKSTAHKSLPSYKSILISDSIQYLYCTYTVPILYIGSFLYCTVQYTGKQYIQKYILPQNDSISHCTILNLRPYLGNIFLLIIQNILSLQR